MQQVILTKEMLWADYMAEVADTLNDFLGLSKEEHRRITKLSQPTEWNVQIWLDGGKVFTPAQYKVIVQGNGLVFLTNLVYLTSAQERNFLAARAQVREFQQEYMDKLLFIGTRLDV